MGGRGIGSAGRLVDAVNQQPQPAVVAAFDGEDEPGQAVQVWFVRFIRQGAALDHFPPRQNQV